MIPLCISRIEEDFGSNYGVEQAIRKENDGMSNISMVIALVSVVALVLSIDLWIGRKR